MNWYDAMEEAYNKGYTKGREDAAKEVERGRWIKHPGGWVECSECLVCGSPKWKVCPVCETKMEAVERRADLQDIRNGCLYFRTKY